MSEATVVRKLPAKFAFSIVATCAVPPIYSGGWPYFDSVSSTKMGLNNSSPVKTKYSAQTRQRHQVPLTNNLSSQKRFNTTYVTSVRQLQNGIAQLQRIILNTLNNYITRF